jgi:hypothetical protein
MVNALKQSIRWLTGEKPDSRQALEKMGRAIAEVETRRRKHWLLKALDLSDLNEIARLKVAGFDSTPAGWF